MENCLRPLLHFLLFLLEQAQALPLLIYAKIFLWQPRHSAAGNSSFSSQCTFTSLRVVLNLALYMGERQLRPDTLLMQSFLTRTVPFSSIMFLMRYTVLDYLKVNLKAS